MLQGGGLLQGGGGAQGDPHQQAVHAAPATGPGVHGRACGTPSLLSCSSQGVASLLQCFHMHQAGLSGSCKLTSMVFTKPAHQAVHAAPAAGAGVHGRACSALTGLCKPLRDLMCSKLWAFWLVQAHQDGLERAARQHALHLAPAASPEIHDRAPCLLSWGWQRQASLHSGSYSLPAARRPHHSERRNSDLSH